MSRNPGTGVYTLPAGTYGAPNTPIASAKYNAAMGDLEQDANAARPIASGGTNATNAAAARENLGTDDAANLTKGTVPDARLGANVVRRNTYPNATSANALAEGLSITDGPSLTNFPYNSSVNNWRTLTIGSAGRGTQITQNYNDLSALYFRGAQDGWSAQWNTIWHNGNDGAGSGLDAGLFAGQLPSYYTNILARLGYTPANAAGQTFGGGIGVGGATPSGTWNNGKCIAIGDSDTGLRQAGDGVLDVFTNDIRRCRFGDDGVTYFTVNGFKLNGQDVVRDDGGTYGINIGGAANTANTATNANNFGGQLPAYYTNIAARLGYTPADSSQQIVAGNGLTGGGNLAADRTVTLGSPSSITNVSTNSVGSTTHSHALGFTAAEVYTGTGAADTTMAVGHQVSAIGTVNRNAPTNVWLDSSSNTDYRTTSDGAQLAGTYRGRGRPSTGNVFVQRTA
jgi:hypothetical protein